jgi:DNA polymerase III subunit delta'
VGFEQFLGNAATVTHLRESIRAGRFPHSLILAGPRGAGKYMLARMLAQAVNCLASAESDGLPDFCGRCANCVRIAEAANLEERVAEAVAAREELRETDKRETRILVQTHPDVLVIPPDPPQLLIKLGQVRQAIHAAYYRPPVEARRAFTIFTSSAFMKEAANSLLKLLEEPPEHTTLILLTENPQELLPTIRSRGVIHRLGALPPAELEALLAARRPELKPRDRALTARLAEGAVGRALSLDLAAYLLSRQDALVILRTALDASASSAPKSSAAGREPDYAQLFRTTETYRAGAEGQEKTANLLRAMGSLLEDLLLLAAGAPELIRNIDLAAELGVVAEGLTLEWIDGAARALSQVEQGMRRNLLRSLSLDAMAVSLG